MKDTESQRDQVRSGVAVTIENRRQDKLFAEGAIYLANTYS
jgi:hypothetical protein